MIQTIEIEVIDDKEVIYYDIIDYNSNITNHNITEEEKLKIIKLNEEFNNIIQKGKLELSARNKF